MGQQMPPPQQPQQPQYTQPAQGYGPPPGYGQQQNYNPPPQPLPNYLIPSILITLFCCQVGIAGIVFAAQADGRFAAGDYAGARDLSNKAKTWTLISLALGLSVYVLMFLLWAASSLVFMSTSG